MPPIEPVNRYIPEWFFTQFMNSPEDEIPLPSEPILSEEETEKQLKSDFCKQHYNQAVNDAIAVVREFALNWRGVHMHTDYTCTTINEKLRKLLK